MIQALRQRHRWMTAAMGAVALGGMVVGLASRPAPAVMAKLPAILLQPPQNDRLVDPDARAERLLSGGVVHWQGAKLETRIYERSVGLRVSGPLYRPDPLLYWAPTTVRRGAPLPAGAVLMGAITSGRRRFALPKSSGALLFFSLAHGEVFASRSLAPEVRR